MRARHVAALFAAALTGTLITASLKAQEDDLFAFIPAGGRTLLADLLANGAPADQIVAIVSGQHANRDEWVADLRSRAGAIPGLGELDETELATLADYLSFHMPLPADRVPADLAAVNWGAALPPDGRDLVLTHCQSCHIITVTVTQDRTKEAWLGTMNKPSHVEISTSPAEREEIANYLVLNAGIPIEQIPEDLRAGGASY